jgi:hypothetical protein
MVRAERSVPTGGAAVGNAMARIGPDITKLGLTIQDKRDEVDRFETEKRFQEFKFAKAKDLDERMRSMEPGQAAGFADTWTGGYTEEAKAFFETVPERLKRDYDEKLFDVERSYFGKAKSFEYGEQKRTALNAMEDHKYRLAASDDLDSARRDYDSLLAANPWLTPIEKDELRRKDMDELEELNVEHRISRGDALGEIIADLETPTQTGKNVDEVVQSKYSHLTPKRRAALIYRVKTALSAETQLALTDDVERLRATGEAPVDANGKTSLDRAAGLLTPNQFEKARQKWEAAKMEHDAVAPLPNMSDDEALDHVARIIPDAEASDESYAAAVRVQAKALRAAEEQAKERKRDPAAAVTASPEVIAAKEQLAAMQRVTTDTMGEVQAQFAVPPAQANALIIKARLEAQVRLGIREPAPITRAEARDLFQMSGSPSKMPQGEFREKLKEASARAVEMYGPYAKQAFETASKILITDDGQESISASMLRKITSGEGITEYDVRASQALSTVSAGDALFAPPPEAMEEQRYATMRYLNNAWPTPPPGAIAKLKKDHSLADGFNAKYGPGSATAIIAEDLYGVPPK